MILLIKNIFKWNIISLKLNGENPYNLYVFIFIFICVLSSLIIRSSFISLDMLNSNNEIIIMIIKLLFLFTILYTIKLILDILKRGIQAFKIIPDFIYWYKQDVKDIKQIITSYYILNILLILLSSYILYYIMIKLNVFIENVYLYIIISGIISSFIFFNYYPINKFYLNTNIKEYSLFIYLLFIFFILFYLFILPFIFINIINSEKILSFKNDFLQKCYENTQNHNMSSPNSGRRIINTINNNRNIISVPDSENLNTSNNISDNTNAIEVRNNNQINLTVQNNYSLNSNTNVQPQPQNNSLLTQSNESSSSTQPQQNIGSPPEYNANNSYGISRSSIEQLIKDGFGNLFTTMKDINNSSNILDINNQISNKNIDNLLSNNDIKNQINKVNNEVLVDSNTQIIEIPRIEITSIEDNLFSNNIINNIIDNKEEDLITKSKLKNNISQENINYINKSSGLKNQINQIFNGLRKIKSESNLIKNIFYKKIDIKEFPLDPNNLLKIPQDLYDSMFNNTREIILWLKTQNIKSNYAFEDKHKFFLELYSHIKWNKDIQENLFKLINSNNEINNNIKYIIKNYYIDYNFEKSEEIQLNFNKNLYTIIHPLFSISSLSSISECSLREFYMLNDFDYLNIKNNKKIISIYLINDLMNGSYELKTLWEYNNSNINLLKLYDQYNNNLTQFVNCFDSSTFENYNNKLNQSDSIKYVTWENIKKTREISFFGILFK